MDFSGTKIIVRYAETDQMGVAHHSVYPIWYEAARTEYIKTFGMSYSQMEKRGIMLPLVELTSRYLRPAHYEDELTVTVSVRLLTRVKIEFYYEIRNQEKELLNTGTTLHAWTDLNLKPMNLQKKFPEIYDLLQQAKSGGEKE
jgi:acyl-CoA thioester hydrolase